MFIGVVGEGFDPRDTLPALNTALNTAFNTGSVSGWVVDTEGPSELMHKRGRLAAWLGGEAQHYAGPDWRPPMEVGDVVGMLLNLGDGTGGGCLTAYLNGRRLGEMVPGIERGGEVWNAETSTFDAYPVEGLVKGPIRWVVDIHHGCALRIDGPKEPPTLTAADLAQDASWKQQWDEREERHAHSEYSSSGDSSSSDSDG